MNIAICDDDSTIVATVRRMIERFLKDLKFDHEIYVFKSGGELLRRNAKYDMAFLDIEMPGISGLEVARRLKQKNPYTITIFITSYQHYLDDALMLHPFGYISKPIDRQRFHKVLKKALDSYLRESKPLRVKSNDEISKVNTGEIVYAAIEQRKVHLHTVDRDIETNEPLEYWKEKLCGESFCQVHQSYIVNLNYVQKITKNTAILSYQDETVEVHVSARKYAAFKRAYFSFIGGLDK